jgi:hypothetical protein
VSYGEQAVGRSFNPSGNPLVDSIKEKYAAIIDSLNDMRATASDGEEKQGGFSMLRRNCFRVLYASCLDGLHHLLVNAVLIDGHGVVATQ